jgi:cobalamin biosynthesis protein CobT
MSNVNTSGTPAWLAAVTLHLVTRTLERAKIPVEVTAWSSTDFYTAQGVIQETLQQAVNDAVKAGRLSTTDQKALQKFTEEEHRRLTLLYSRFGGLLFLTLKSWNESWEVVKHRLKEVTGRAATYDAEGIRKAAQSLLCRPEKRKVLFVFTDGEPAPEPGEDGTRFEAYLHEVVREIRAHGIELICFGMQSPGAAAYYAPGFVNLNRLEDMPQVVIGQLKKVLIGGSNARRV